MIETYAFGDFRLDVAARDVSYRGTPIKLTAKCIAVLAELARRAPAVVSREEFETAVWPEGYIEASNLTQTIYMIRTTFARFEQTPIIETKTNRGYRLALPISESTRSLRFRAGQRRRGTKCAHGHELLGNAALRVTATNSDQTSITTGMMMGLRLVLS